MFWGQTAHVDVFVDGHALRGWHVAVASAAVAFGQDAGNDDEEDDCQGDCERDEDDEANGEFVVWLSC